jgi:hypothetical protein
VPYVGLAASLTRRRRRALKAGAAAGIGGSSTYVFERYCRNVVCWVRAVLTFGITMPNPSNTACVEACCECATACSQCLTACLQEPYVNALTRCIALDVECAEMCRFTLAAVARGSEQLVVICRLCAEICDLCAEECSKHEHEHCRRCADACMKCSAACHQMVEQVLEGARTPQMASTG